MSLSLNLSVIAGYSLLVTTNRKKIKVAKKVKQQQ